MNSNHHILECSTFCRLWEYRRHTKAKGAQSWQRSITIFEICASFVAIGHAQVEFCATQEYERSVGDTSTPKFIALCRTLFYNMFLQDAKVEKINYWLENPNPILKLLVRIYIVTYSTILTSSLKKPNKLKWNFDTYLQPPQYVR